MSTGFNVAEIQQENRERFRLETERQDFFDLGTEMNTLARLCIALAHKCFDQVQKIEKRQEVL